MKGSRSDGQGESVRENREEFLLVIEGRKCSEKGRNMLRNVKYGETGRTCWERLLEGKIIDKRGGIFQKGEVL